MFAWDQFQRHLASDPHIQRLTKDVQNGKAPVGFVLEEGKLFYKGRIMVPPKSELIGALLCEYHDSPVGGHSCELKTYLRLAA